MEGENTRSPSTRRRAPVLRHRRGRAERTLGLVRGLLRGLEPGDVSDVLVIGSGSGRIVGGLAAAYPFRVVGVDLDEERTAEARSSYGTVERTRFETSDPRRLPFAAASFDLVVTQASYHRPAEWQAALEEAGRVLRPAGHLFWLDLEVEPEQRTLLRLWRHRYGLYTPDEVRAAHGGATASGSHFRRLARPETRREPLVLVKEPRAA